MVILERFKNPGYFQFSVMMEKTIDDLTGKCKEFNWIKEGIYLEKPGQAMHYLPENCSIKGSLGNTTAEKIAAAFVNASHGQQKGVAMTYGSLIDLVNHEVKSEKMELLGAALQLCNCYSDGKIIIMGLKDEIIKTIIEYNKNKLSET